MVGFPRKSIALRDSGILSTAHDAATANGDCDTGKFAGWDPMFGEDSRCLQICAMVQVVFLRHGAMVVIPKFHPVFDDWMAQVKSLLLERLERRNDHDSSGQSFIL